MLQKKILRYQKAQPNFENGGTGQGSMADCRKGAIIRGSSGKKGGGARNNGAIGE